MRILRKLRHKEGHSGQPACEYESGLIGQSEWAAVHNGSGLLEARIMLTKKPVTFNWVLHNSGRAATRRRQAWKESAERLWQACRVNGACFECPVEVEISSTVPCPERLFDVDALAAVNKWTLDSAVDAAILADDSPEWVRRMVCSAPEVDASVPHSTTTYQIRQIGASQH